ncbi:CS1-pili formation C-terminal domain-containing protein [Pseudomonas sp. CFBP 8758]|uniref:CS1-pili formation C-terminal domain-containing protein n=1 Tax=Pseudomonas baltica TaxID=2762576 RepID=A0A7X1G4Z3_9PSED|nr:MULTISPECIES: TcfC E-set like domain-containing protein [Pseudomonas]MBC2678590.1 CS1-pili formation C-terminal domain-containing protein [Pseudomonas baltica]MBD8592554.1 CS1-pili formation C-terminal domain-containing protein [Pseudomonas sp. CFBP 8758]
MTRITPTVFTGPLALGLLSLVALSPTTVTGNTNIATTALSSQAQGLPREFNEHFYDVPLAVHVDLDGRGLGEALITLDRQERVQLIEFTADEEGRAPDPLRQRWADYLADPVPLGNCTQSCRDDLVALHYSLYDSRLSILTRTVERTAQDQRYHALPEHGSHGMILRNQLNISAGRFEQVGRYALQGQGSLGDWTTLAQLQADRSDDDRYGTRHRVDQLYAERMDQGHFYRLGYFMPDAQGLTRQPRLLGDTPLTALGVMYGSSDSLAVDNATPSATPIYVTPNRPGVVEIYRNGVLINSQPVQPGLQAIDTKVLPGGIYDVEVRLIEDGQTTASNEAFIYKPSNWSNPDQPWRYNLYLGQRRTLLSNWEEDSDDSLSSGVLLNYLAHSRVVLGSSLQRVGDYTQYGLSADWDALQSTKLYANVYHTDQHGQGYDLQALWNYRAGNLVLSRNQSWQRYPRLRGEREPRPGQQVIQTSLSWQHRMDRRFSTHTRIARDDGLYAGTSVDLGLVYHGKLMGSDANWRASVFDRPGTLATDGARNRGVNFTLSMSLGQEGRRLSATLGSRTALDGTRDRNVSVTYQQSLEHHTLRNVAGTLTGDRYGAALAANVQFQNSMVYGDAYVQNSSYDHAVSGGLNLESTVAVGAGKAAISGDFQPYEAGMIVDVESDLDNLRVRADSLQGPSATLRPGRNILPLRAYRPGQVLMDFEGLEAHAAVIQPSSFSYHLNRGAVTYQKVRIMRTVTVLGRLLDAGGAPIKGAMVINHASRSLSEADGFFAVEMSESTPTLEVRRSGARLCFLKLDEKNAQRENEVLMVGDQQCSPDTLAATGNNHEGDAG